MPTHSKGQLGWLVAFVASVLSACTGELEVIGKTDRLVGEEVIFDLIDGADGITLSGDVLLIDANGAQFEASALDAAFDDKTLTIKIPVGVAAGEASVRIEQTGFDNNTDLIVPITVNRIATTITAAGMLSFLPIPPSPIAPFSQDIGPRGADVDFSPDGGTIWVIANNQVQAFRTGSPPVARTPYSAPGAVSLSAGQNSAAVLQQDSTPEQTKIIFLEIGATGGSINDTVFQVPDAKRVALAATGTRIAVLTSCDSNNDSTREDCVVVINLSTKAVADPIRIDDTDDATQIAITPDGGQVVVADTRGIRAVDVSQVPAVVQSSAEIWSGSGGRPTAFSGIDVAGNFAFVVADEANSELRAIGFDPTNNFNLRGVQGYPIGLDIEPAHVAFAQGDQLLLFAKDGRIQRVDAFPTPGAIETLSLNASGGPFVGIAAQR